MAIYAISDIHVKVDGKNSEVLKSFIFLNFKKGDIVYFLGDIFDLLVGPHKEYFSVYDWFFKRVNELSNNGIEIHYFEGNHDFHLERLFDKSIILYKSPCLKDYYGYRILFCHGDEIEIENSSYKLYKSFITSRPLNFIANYIMPYSLLKSIGQKASKKSRIRNKSKYSNSENQERIRENFRKASKIAAKKFQANVVICGHSHLKDDYSWESGRYLNCGYLPHTKNCIKIDENKIEFINLNP